MKKIVLLMSIVGMTLLMSCEGPPGPPGKDGLIGVVYETNPISFLPASYSYNYVFPRAIYLSDVVLVYRLAGNVNGNDLWEFLPETHYFADGTRDFTYNFDFTIRDVQIYLEGNDLQTLSPNFRLNQIFRIVIIPGYFSGKMANSDFNNYNEVIKRFNIDDSNIKVLNR